MKVHEPNEVQFKMELTLTLGQWKSLQKQIDNGTVSEPAWSIRQKIWSMIAQAEKEFSPQIEK